MDTEEIREIAWKYSESLLSEIKKNGGSTFDMIVAVEMMKNYASATDIIKQFVDKSHLTEVL